MNNIFCINVWRINIRLKTIRIILYPLFYNFDLQVFVRRLNVFLLYMYCSFIVHKTQRETIYTQKKITITQLSSHNLGPFEQNPDRQRFTDCKILNLLRNHLMPLISGAGEVLRPSVWNFHVIAYSVTSLCYVTLPADLVETYIVLGRLYRD